MKNISVLIILLSSILFAQNREVIPLSKTEFTYINKKGIEKEIDLTGKDFILVSVREEDSDGRFYAVDKDGTVWLSGGVSSGEEMEFTPSGKWKVLRKERHYMSKEFPDEDGNNNMDYSLFFTYNGHALHKGNINMTSHGCIHVDPTDIQMLYKWSKLRMPVLVTRHRYMRFARSDLRRIY
ncbi:L,D-transpeptidase [Sulfurovum sp.]|uniref:L,D-transpeptidase n=1 Tax=Sulfurovum sp. TaxID=1969726 RepID=UPI0028682AA8|nr:L,D-transpeptidase [Sulfurovum sp.]